MKQRGLEIMHGHDIAHSLVAEVIGRPVNMTRLESAAGQPEGKSVPVMIAAIIPLRNRETAEFSGPEHDRLVEQAALLQVHHEALHLVDPCGHRAT